MVGIRELLDLVTWRAHDVAPDGTLLAANDVSGSMQLAEIGTGGEVRALTALDGACSGRLLPGTRQVVVSHDSGGDERAQLSLLDLDSANQPCTVDGMEPLVRDPEYVHDLQDVLPGRVVYRTNRRNGVDFDVVVRNVVTGTEEVLYAEGGLAGDAAVSADARYLALTRPAEAAMSDQLLLVDAMPETPDQRVTAVTGADERAQHGGVHWLGASDSLVLTTDRGREFTGVARYDVSAREWHWLVTDDGHDLAAWPSPDGRLLLVRANVDATARLAVHDADGTFLHEVALPDGGWVGFPVPDPVWSADSRYVAVTFSAPEVPGDVLFVDAATGSVHAGADSAGQLGGARLSSPTAHWIPGDGGAIQCHAYPPTSTVDGLAGAAVLVVHGGPEAQETCTFNPVIQGLAAAGLTVLVPNVRGSTGYGKSWYAADDGRRRLDSVADLAALHAYLPSLGLDRAALWGGSYGGYMVLAGLAFQPELWSAGVDIVGISSLVTFLTNTSDYRRAHREREYGSLRRDRDFLEAASPLSRVDQVRAPLFVVHGANDPRVPLDEAHQLRDELHSRGVECELAVYPDEGHGLAKRANRMDAYPRAVEFLTHHLAR